MKPEAETLPLVMLVYAYDVHNTRRPEPLAPELLGFAGSHSLWFRQAQIIVEQFPGINLDLALDTIKMLAF